MYNLYLNAKPALSNMCEESWITKLTTYIVI